VDIVGFYYKNMSRCTFLWMSKTTQWSKHPHIHRPKHYKTHTYTNPHITKQVKTNTVRDTDTKWSSQNINKYTQY